MDFTNIKLSIYDCSTEIFFVEFFIFLRFPFDICCPSNIGILLVIFYKMYTNQINVLINIIFY